MKKYEFNISDVVLSKFFPQERIKTKAQIIEILMEAIRYMLINPLIDKDRVKGKIILYVDKMSRLFFIKDKKYFSIVFPFLVNEYNDKLKFSFQNTIDVTPQLISKTISIIQCDEFKDNCSLDFVAPICEYEEECDENFWIFLRELLLMEDGYIRYDYDKEHENGDLHPLNHYDLFYSNHATFKIGLNDILSEDEFVDLLDIKSDCKYLK